MFNPILTYLKQQKTLLHLLLIAVVLCGLWGVFAVRASPAASSLLAGPSPSMISYQGVVKVSGMPYIGNGYFKFAIVNAGGTVTYWSNDGTSAGGSQPVASVPLPVDQGLFNVLLGDTGLAGMTQPLAPSVFNGIQRYLRVWFSSDGTTFTLLTPDQRVVSVPYALQAAEAQNTSQLGNQPANAYQERVTGTCPVGSAVLVVKEDGSVECSTPNYYPLLQAQSIDMASVNNALKGFIGGFSDGRYGYFVPYNNGGSASGVVARLNLQTFNTAGVSYLDLTAGGDSSLKGFQGGFTDGRYGYFVPNYNGAYFGKVVRVDLQDFATVNVLDLTAGGDSSLKGYSGGFTDGRYGYLVPYYNGKAIQIDLQNFTSGGVNVLDLTSIGDSSLVGFAGGFTDGRYGYYVPNYNGIDYASKLVRVDLQNFIPAGVTVLDLTATGDSSLKGFYGGFTDGRYGYLVPLYHNSYFGKLVRVDLQNFIPAGVTVLDLTAVNSSLKGFCGGFTDGRYGYFVPYITAASNFSGKLTRVDLQNFTTTGVTWLDLAALDSNLKGFCGGFMDGRFGYLVPDYNGSSSGKVARIPLFFGGGAP